MDLNVGGNCIHNFYINQVKKKDEYENIKEYD